MGLKKEKESGELVRFFCFSLSSFAVKLLLPPGTGKEQRKLTLGRITLDLVEVVLFVVVRVEVKLNPSRPSRRRVFFFDFDGGSRRKRLL